MGERANVSLTLDAAWPSGEAASSTAIVMDPSIPVKTLVLATVGSFSLEVHGDADEVDRERRPERHDDGADAGDLLGAGGAHREVVADEHLVEHHLREEAVEGGPQSGPDPSVVEAADVRVGTEPDAGLRIVHGAADADLGEGWRRRG